MHKNPAETKLESIIITCQFLHQCWRSSCSVVPLPLQAPPLAGELQCVKISHTHRHRI